MLDRLGRFPGKGVHIMSAMKRLRIWHETVYQFSGPVQLGPHRLLLRPREGHDVRIESSRLDISPPGHVKWYRDAQDNSVAIVDFAARASRLSIVSDVAIQHYDEAPLDFVVADYAVRYPFEYLVEEAVDLAPFREPGTGSGRRLQDWLSGIWRPGETTETYVLLDRMSHTIAQELQYRVREEPGVQAPEHTLATAAGSCRDFAFLLMEAARSLGLAARFVSGYLHAPATERGYGATHAWAEIYLPGAGWKGFDPTAGGVTGSHHIAVAVARRPEAVPPVAGEFRGPDSERPTLEVRVGVRED
jgi:transglutaminase-like putative cysteine protease